MREMFIENPNKKTTYSFRVKPDLLEDIKLYAKATKTTVPELLNNMIDEKVEDLHLTNDYLDSKLDFNRVLSLPSLTEMYNDGNYKEYNLFNCNAGGSLYEIEKLPNNLDIWTDDKGYTSNKRGVDHEGLSFVLAPELITKSEYLENPDLLLCCLVPIYFKVSINSIRASTVAVKNISLENALKMINQAPDIGLLDKFTNFTFMVKEECKRFKIILDSARENPDGSYYAGGTGYAHKQLLLMDLWAKLILHLEEYSKEINTDIVKHEDKVIERETERENNTEKYTMSELIEKLEEANEFNFELNEKDKVIEELQTELDEVKDKQEKIMRMFEEYINLSKLTDGKYEEYNMSK